MSLYKMLFEDPNTKKYTAIGGSIVIVIAMAGIFVHEAGAYKTINLEDIQIGGFGTSTFTIEWPESGPDTSTWAESNDVSVNFDLTHGNLTKVMITLLWTDDEIVQGPFGARADRLYLTVTPPGLEVKSGDSTSGQVSLDYTVNQPPDKVEGLSGGEIEENLQTHDDANGKGTWTFTVDVQPQPVTDSGNSWNLEFSYYWYEANVIEEEQE